MSSDLQTLLTEAERSFRKACEQILQLNRRMDEMSKRYDKASRENNRSFRYSLRLRMAVTEGVRNMYYEYAANKADEITHLRCQVVRAERLSGNNEARLPGEDDNDNDEEGANEIDDNIRGIVSDYVNLDGVPRMLIHLRNNPVLVDGAAVVGNAEEGDDDDDSVSDLEEQEEEDENADVEDDVMHVENMEDDSEEVINSDRSSNTNSSQETVI